MKGLRFERRGEGHYYKVVLHIDDVFIPLSDDVIETLKEQSQYPAERFLDVFVKTVGYSPYLQEQIQHALRNSGDPITKAKELQAAIHEF